MNDSRIMLVMQSAVRTRSIAQVLKHAGFRNIVLQQTGKDALGYLLKGGADLVLLDAEPEEHQKGAETVRRIREQSEAPILFLTSEKAEASTDQAPSGDSIYTLRSPFSDRELCREVEFLLCRRQGEAALASATEALHQTEERLSAILESARDCIFVKDTSSTYLHGNRAFRELFRLRPEEVKGLTDEDIFCKEEAKRIRGDDLRVLKGEVLTNIDAKPVEGLGRRFHVVKTPIRDSSGVICGLCGIARDITRDVQMLEALQESEKKYRLLAESITDVVCIHDLKGSILYASPSVEGAIGWIPDEIVGRSFFELVHPDDVEAVKRHLASLIISGQPGIQINRAVKKDGSSIWMESAVDLIIDESGQPQSILCSCRDITARRAAEEALVQSEARLNSILTAAPMAVGLLQNRVLKWANDPFFQITGYSYEELVDRNLNILYHTEEEYERVGKVKYDQIRRNGVGEVETQFRRRDGKTIDVRLRSAMVNPKAPEEGTISTAVDITEHKLTERALRESEEKYRLLFEEAGLGIGYWSVDGHLLSLNKTAREHFGGSPAGWAGKSAPEIFGTTLGSEIVERIRRVVQEKVSINFEDCVALREKEYWFESVYAPVPDRDGNVRGVQIISRNITEQKLVTESLRASEEKYRTLAENSIQGIAILRQPVSIVYSNGAFAELTGYSVDEMQSLSRDEIVEMIYPDDRELVIDRLSRRLAGESPPSQYEFRIVSKQGEVKWLEINSSGVDWQGESAVQVTAFEITSRKIALQNLHKSEEFNRAVIEQSPVGVSVRSKTGRLLLCNRAWQRINDLGDDQVEEKKNRTPGRLDFDESDEYLADWKPLVQKIYDEGGNLNVPEAMLRLSQERQEIWVSQHFYALKDESGQVDRVVILTVDISEQKRTEEALRDSEKLLRESQEIAGVGSYSRDLVSGDATVSDNSYRLFGYEPGEVKIDYNFVISHIHPEDRPTFAEANRALANESKSFNIVYRITRKDGTVRTMRSRASVELDRTGKPTRQIGALQDITDRVETANQIKQSREKLRELVEHMSSGVAVYQAVDNGADFIFVEYNRAGEQMDGVLRHDIIGKPVSKVFPGIKETGFFRVFQRVWRTGEPEFLPAALYKDDRLTAWRENYVYRLSTGEIVSVYDDVTERKEAEQDLRRLNEELERRVAQRTEELSAINKELEAFAYSVSHDLRAPLRAIDGFSHVLNKDHAEKLDNEGKRVLNIIRSGAQDMGKLIDDLLTFSRANRMLVSKEVVDMKGLIAETTDEIRTRNPGRDVSVTIGELPEVEADKALMRTVFTNLLSNAFKFTKQREQARVEIDGQIEEHEVVYRISDNGVGFDMKFLDKLFTVFQRLHRVDEFEGTGVGLALVQRIVHRHGGRVWAEAEVDQGATFYVSLPRQQGVGV